jgi:iron complex transport system substrate-binding protein
MKYSCGKWFFAVLIVALIFVLAACGGAADKTETPPDASGEAVTETPNTDAITIIDHAGREVIIEKPVERLVSGYYISSSMCIALGISDKLVGIEAKADIRPLYGLAAPQLIALPNVGTAKEFDTEGCIALSPDLVILPKRLIDSANTMADLGIAVILINPESHTELRESIDMIAKATGAEERAAELIAYYDEQIKQAQTAVSSLDAASLPLVYMAGNSSYLSTAPRDMYQATLIEDGGGINAAAEIEGNNWTDISYEQLLSMNPEIILVPAEATYNVDDVLNDEQLADLKAVTAGAVYAMPRSFEAWDMPTPSCTLGTKWILSVLHEDVYPFEDMRQEAVDFYSRFYGVNIDPTLITK